MPGIDKIIQDKLNRLESVPNMLYGQVEKEQVKLLNQALKQIDLLQRTADGKVLLNPKNLLIIEDIGNTMQATMYQGDYVKSVIEFSKEFDQQQVINKDYFDKAFGSFEDKELFELTFQTAKKRAVSQLASGAIAERFIDPLKEALTTNAASGATITDITKFMFEYMTGRKGVEVKDGRLLGWIKQTASDNFAFADREYSNIIADDLGVEWFRYAGGTIPTTRCFCEERNGKIFHISEIKAWGTKPSLWAKNPDLDCKGGGMIAGTNADNIRTFLGGYNCQHSLLALPESSVPIEVKARLGKVEKIIPKEDNGLPIYQNPFNNKTFPQKEAEWQKWRENSELGIAPKSQGEAFHHWGTYKWDDYKAQFESGNLTSETTKLMDKTFKTTSGDWGGNTIYRGMIINKNQVDDFIKTAKQNSLNKSPMSFSKDINIASSYALDAGEINIANETPVMFRLKNAKKSAYDISELSNHPDELEVLIKPNAKLKINSIKTEKIEFGFMGDFEAIVIDMEEIL